MLPVVAKSFPTLIHCNKIRSFHSACGLLARYRRSAPASTESTPSEAIAEGILSGLFDKKQPSKKASLKLPAELLSPVESKLSGMNNFPEKQVSAETPKPSILGSIPDFSAINEDETQNLENDAAKKPLVLSQRESDLSEKLRAKREARKRAKEMISELAEMAQIVDQNDVHTNNELKSESKKEAEDWFVGKSYSVSSTGSQEIETLKIPLSAELQKDSSVDTEEASFTPKWMRVAATGEARKQGLELDNDFKQIRQTDHLTTQSIVNVLEMERGKNIAVVDVSQKCEWTDTMIIAEGQNKKQIYSMIDGVRRAAKKFVATDPSLPANIAIEGAQTDDWMVLDMGRFVVHIMSPKARSFYDLESIWSSVKNEEEEEFAGEKDLLDSVEAAWNTRPISVVKTKQIEKEDLPTPAEFDAMRWSTRKDVLRRA